MAEKSGKNDSSMPYTVYVKGKSYGSCGFGLDPDPEHCTRGNSTEYQIVQYKYTVQYAYLVVYAGAL